MVNMYSTRRWALARSSNTSYIWISKQNKSDGILLRGSSFTRIDSDDVMRWLSTVPHCHNNVITVRRLVVTGIDGYIITCPSFTEDFAFKESYSSGSGTVETVVRSATNNVITVRRLVVKSSSVMRSKRDFVVITCVSILSDGTHIITSRSFAEDFEAPSKNRKDKGYLRGVVYGSGYILHPWKSSDGSESGCEISYACHVDMKGAGVSNAQKAEPLADTVLQTLTTLRDIGHQNDSDGDGVFSEAEDESSACRETLDTRMESMYSESFYADDSNSSLNPSVVDPAYNRGEVNDAIKVGNDALRNMKHLYEVYMRASSSSSKQGEKSRAESKAGWEVHHDEDGITVKELSSYGNMGVLSASVTTSAAPHIVKNSSMKCLRLWIPC